MLISSIFSRHQGRIQLQAEPASTGARIFRNGMEIRQSLGAIAPGSRILLTGHPGQAWLARLLTIWEAGHVAVPVSAHAGVLTKEEAIRISGSEWELHSDSESLISLADSGRSRRRSDSHSPRGGDPPSADSSAALILFTSGTTGIPKGIVLSHHNLLLGAKNVVAHFKLATSDHGLGLLPLTHINGIVTTLLAPVLSGGSVTIHNESFSADRFQSWVRDSAPTWVSGVPFHYERLSESDPGWIRATEIRFFRSAAAPLNPTTLSRFVEQTGKPLVETMGMTECSGQIFANPVEPGAQRPGSVGRPVGFEVEARPLENQESSELKSSEILVRGPALAEGWCETNGEHHPFPRDQFLPTGDLGYIDDDGFVFITGRLKETANIGGIKIPLRLLESVLLEIDGIHDAAISPEDNHRFTIFVVVGNETRPATAGAVAEDTRCVRDGLVDRISASLLGRSPVPVKVSRVVIVEQLPRTGTGKLIRHKLAHCAPIQVLEADETSQDVFALIGQRLGMESDSLKDNLSLGHSPAWDSLLQVDIIEALESVLGRRLTADEANRSESIAGIKKILAGDTHGAPAVVGRAGEVQAYLDEMQNTGFARSTHTLLIVTHRSLIEAGDIKVDDFIAAATERAGGGVLLMNTFTWSFCRTGRYHSELTSCETGLVAEQFRKRHSTFRTRHPMYSFAVSGEDQELRRMEFIPDGWDRRSVLGYLCEDVDLNVVIDGLEVLKGNPAIHYVERALQVPYRYTKQFSGKACFDGDVYQDCVAEMYVRRQGVDGYRNDWSRLIEEMNSGGAIVRSRKYPSLYGYRNADLVGSAKALLERDRFALASKVDC